MFDKYLSRTPSKGIAPASLWGSTKTRTLTIVRLDTTLEALPITYDLTRDPDITRGTSLDAIAGYYQLNYNDISLRPKASYCDDLLYYLVAVHETVHWTGGEGQLNRTTVLRAIAPTKEAYCIAEELVAELVSCAFLESLGYKLPEWALDRMLFFKRQIPPLCLEVTLREAQKAYNFVSQLL